MRRAPHDEPSRARPSITISLPHASQSLPFAYSISQQTTTSLLLHSCTLPLYAADIQSNLHTRSRCRATPYEQAPHDPIAWATPPLARSPQRNNDWRSHTFGSHCSNDTERFTRKETFPAFGARRTRRSTARSASRVAPSRSDPRDHVDVKTRHDLFS